MDAFSTLLFLIIIYVFISSNYETKSSIELLIYYLAFLVIKSSSIYTFSFGRYIYDYSYSFTCDGFYSSSNLSLIIMSFKFYFGYNL